MYAQTGFDHTTYNSAVWDETTKPRSQGAFLGL
jgi:hypothetical protein